jgi:hypothetical protein
MTKYIASVKVSYQISEDQWQVSTKHLQIEPTTPVSEIFKWVEINKADINTITISRLDEIQQLS